MKVGAKLFEKNSHPNLQTLVHNTYLRMAKDLAWLEQKTNTFENPAEKRLEELRRICILNDINNPIIGEDLYDPKKPDTTRQKMQFRNMIRKQADNLDIFRNYKRDRREVMGQCLMKGEEYENEKKRKQEIFITSMRYYVFGAESLSKKELKMLKDAGVIKRKKSRFQQIIEGGAANDSDEEEESKDLIQEAKEYMAENAQNSMISS